MCKLSEVFGLSSSGDFEPGAAGSEGSGEIVAEDCPPGANTRSKLCEVCSQKRH